MSNKRTYLGRVFRADGAFNSRLPCGAKDCICHEIVVVHGTEDIVIALENAKEGEPQILSVLTSAPYQITATINERIVKKLPDPGVDAIKSSIPPSLRSLVDEGMVEVLNLSSILSPPKSRFEITEGEIVVHYPTMDFVFDYEGPMGSVDREMIDEARKVIAKHVDTIRTRTKNNIYIKGIMRDVLDPIMSSEKTPA